MASKYACPMCVILGYHKSSVAYILCCFIFLHKPRGFFYRLSSRDFPVSEFLLYPQAPCTSAGRSKAAQSLAWFSVHIKEAAFCWKPQKGNLESDHLDVLMSPQMVALRV